MRDALYGMPLWLLGLLLVLAVEGLSIAGLMVARRWILPRFDIRSEDSDFSSGITQSVMVFYGLIVALIAVSVWQKHSQVEDVVSAEAAAIASLWRDLGGYPSPQKETIRGGLKSYTDYTINVAWPRQRKGEVPRAGIDMLDRLQAQLFTFEPATEGQKLLHAETLRAYNHFILQRRLRLDAVVSSLPGVLWQVILIGATLSMGVSCLFKVSDARYHMLMVSLLGLFVALVTFVIFALDHPFRGDLGIPSDSYRLVFEQLMSP